MGGFSPVAVRFPVEGKKSSTSVNRSALTRSLGLSPEYSPARLIPHTLNWWPWLARPLMRLTTSRRPRRWPMRAVVSNRHLATLRAPRTEIAVIVLNPGLFYPGGGLLA